MKVETKGEISVHRRGIRQPHKFANAMYKEYWSHYSDTLCDGY